MNERVETCRCKEGRQAAVAFAERALDEAVPVDLLCRTRNEEKQQRNGPVWQSASGRVNGSHHAVQFRNEERQQDVAGVEDAVEQGSRAYTDEQVARAESAAVFPPRHDLREGNCRKNRCCHRHLGPEDALGKIKDDIPEYNRHDKRCREHRQAPAGFLLRNSPPVGHSARTTFPLCSPASSFLCASAASEIGITLSISGTTRRSATSRMTAAMSAFVPRKRPWTLRW